jgi:hypothetical protein
VVHLNIPQDREPWWKTFLRKAKWMSIALIAPELVTGLAIEQYRQARALTVFMRNGSVHDWHSIHSFYAIMGGFRFADGTHDKRIKALDPRENFESFQDMLLAHRSSLPSKEEIEDKSKADAFVKGFAVLQSCWLVGQCIARACYHLPISELELSTCGFVACTIISYRYWWHKPLDVSSATILNATTRISNAEQPNVEQPSGAAGLPETPAQSAYQPPTPPHYAGPKRIQNFQSFFSRSPLDDRSVFDIEDDPRDYTDYRIACQGLSETIVYAVCVGVVFGAIHLAAWDFSFPTKTERIAWRVSSLMITLLAPMSLLSVGAFLCYEFSVCIANECAHQVIDERPWKGITLALLVLYLIARFTLIALILSCFRSMPAEIYVTIVWLQYVPHF